MRRVFANDIHVWNILRLKQISGNPRQIEMDFIAIFPTSLGPQFSSPLFLTKLLITITQNWQTVNPFSTAINIRCDVVNSKCTFWSNPSLCAELFITNLSLNFHCSKLTQWTFDITCIATIVTTSQDTGYFWISKLTYVCYKRGVWDVVFLLYVLYRTLLFYPTGCHLPPRKKKLAPMTYL